MNDVSSNGEGSRYQLRRIGCPATRSGVADVFQITQEVTLIGRAKDKVQFFIDSSNHKGLISRIHARIFKSQTQSGNDVFQIYDTSLNGTFVNNIKISSETSLKPGDTVTFGHLLGATLQAGKVYSQPNSEFHFKFECSPENQLSLKNSDNVESSRLETMDSPLRHHRTPVTPAVPDLSIFIETPTPPFAAQSLSGDSKHTKCPTKRGLVKNFEHSENDGSETDYKVLQEYASAAALAATTQSDSDEDLFSLKYTDILPGAATDVALSDNSMKRNSPEKKRLKPRKSSRCSKKTSSDNLQSCASKKCLKPRDKIIPWVQCDSCDAWYHIKCTGLSFKLVKPKNAQFHCGCT